MAPRKVSKERLVALIDELAPSAPLPKVPEVEHLKASDLVTYPALTGILKTLEERHAGLVALMTQGFSNMQREGSERGNQITKAEAALNARISEEVLRNDKRFTGVLIACLVLFLGEIVRFFVSK